MRIPKEAEGRTWRHGIVAAAVLLAAFSTTRCSGDDSQGHPDQDAEVPTEYCNPNPCMNGGVCEDGLTSYLCLCPVGYTGERCEETSDTWYVSPDGDGTACTREAPCLLDYAKSNASVGSTVLLMNGDYGDVAFDTGLGEAGRYVRFVADPDTTVPRDESWYEGDLERPEAGSSVIFTGLLFERLDESGYFIEVDGVNVVGGNISMYGTVTDVTIRRCNVFGDWSEYVDEVTDSAVSIYYWDYETSNYVNILVEDCYSEYTAAGLHINGRFDALLIRHNHFHKFAGSGIRTSSSSGSAYFHGNHVHQQIPLASTPETYSAVASVSGDLLSVTLTVAADTWDLAELTMPGGDKYLAQMENANVQDATVVLLTEPLPFTPEIGSEVVFWDENHGSCFAMTSRSDMHIVGNLIHDCGTSQGIGFYVNEMLENYTFAHNLVYSTINQYTFKFNSGSDALGFGPGCVIEKNTIIGSKAASQYQGQRAYGWAFLPQFGSSDVVVRNNLFIGISDCSADVTCQDNIVYAGEGFEEDAEGPNMNNIVYYDGEPFGSEPYPFDGNGVFFVGGEHFEDEAFNRTHTNMNSYFVPVAGSDACKDGVITHGHLAGEPCR